MRLVYMDEAGVSHPDQEPFCVVAGVIVDADKQLLNLGRQLDDLIVRHIGALMLPVFIFHAYELFAGEGFFNDREFWPLKRRLEIAGDLAKLIGEANLPISLGWNDRKDFRKRWSENPDTAKLKLKDTDIATHVSSQIQCTMSVEHWMRNEAAPDEVALLVVEDNDQARAMIRNVHAGYQDPYLVASLPDQEIVQRHFPLRRIVQDPLFEPKRRGSILQLADFCAYVWKRTLMQDKYIFPFFDPWRRNIAVHA